MLKEVLRRLKNLFKRVFVGLGSNNQLPESWVNYHDRSRLISVLSVAEGQMSNDAELVARIVAAYREAESSDIGAPDSMWLTTFAEKTASIRALLKHGSIDEITSLLQSPDKSNIFYGFDHLAQEYYDHMQDIASKEQLARLTHDSLLRLAEAVGVIRLENPEAYGIAKNWLTPLGVEEILEKLDHEVGYKIIFPNPFSNEAGIITSRGIASYRAMQSIYQAYKINNLLRTHSSPRILEIGAGLGRTAYYSWQMRLRNYCVVDLPFTNVSQANFLGRTLGSENIRLYREKTNSKKESVEIFPPESFFSSNEKFDLVVNVDSFTEMSLDTAKKYVNAISKITPCLMSINHEFNQFTVRELLVDLTNVREYSREPYWLRKGYVVEIVQFH
jgi:hypothetical protein